VSTSRTIVGRNPATGAGIAVDIDDGLIASLRPVHTDTELYLSPGLVDLQVNGYGSLDFNAPDLSVDQVAALTNKLGRLGATTFLPTLITASEAGIVKGLATIAEARRRFPAVRHAIPAVHVEGPSISPQDGPRGAHPIEHVRAPSIAEFERWQSACEGLVGLVTLAPEYPEAASYIAELAKKGVIVALGHSAASADQVRDAVDAGARLSTHLGNGAAALLPRHPNFIWAQLADDRLTASFISDGHHLPADTFKAMLRAKGLANAILVSDSVALAGMPAGRYRTPVGGEVEIAANGRIGVADTPYLAGAGYPLITNVAIAMTMAGLSLEQALSLATANPGRFLGRRGQLDVGLPADLMLFRYTAGSPNLDIQTVLVSGQEQVPQ